MIQTPKYWKKERFQPLTEVETMYGNKVQIPKSLKDTWEYYLMAIKTCKNPKKFLQGKMDGYNNHRKNFRTIVFGNLLMVLEEKFKEDEYTEWILSAED